MTTLPATLEEAAKLRQAWAAVKESRAGDQQWLLLMSQSDVVLDHLKHDYDKRLSPYRTTP